jgi:hypothetical protein
MNLLYHPPFPFPKPYRVFHFPELLPRRHQLLHSQSRRHPVGLEDASLIGCAVEALYVTCRKPGKLLAKLGKLWPTGHDRQVSMFRLFTRSKYLRFVRRNKQRNEAGS